jgi:OmpA family
MYQQLEGERIFTGAGSSSEAELFLKELEFESHPPPAGRCTPAGRRVGAFTCSAADRASINASVGPPAVTVSALRGAIEDAAGGAVSLARRGAASLDRTRRNAFIRSVFCEAYGVSPEFVPPWRAGLHGVVGWRDLGELVAIRLRDVAKILDGGCIHYFAWGSPAHCPECHDVPPNYFACSSFTGRYIICLGAAFWRRWRSGDRVTTASTLLHEALHIYFRRTVSDRGRSGNANCYERFVVRLHGLFLHPATAANCTAAACAPPAVVNTLDRFEFDRFTLQPFHIPTIERIAHTAVTSWNTAQPIRTIRLVGHADSRGNPSYNNALGLRRATAVRDRLAVAIRMRNSGLTGRIKFIPETMGAARPIASSTTAAGRARNRRVEISLSRS